MGTRGGAGTVGSCLSYRHLKHRARTWARSGEAQWMQMEKGLTQLLGLSDKSISALTSTWIPTSGMAALRGQGLKQTSWGDEPLQSSQAPPGRGTKSDVSMVRSITGALPSSPQGGSGDSLSHPWGMQTDLVTAQSPFLTALTARLQMEVPRRQPPSGETSKGSIPQPQQSP